MSAFDDHCLHPRLARTIQPRLSDAGFDVFDRDVFVHFETGMDEASFGATFAPLIAEFVGNVDGFGAAEVGAWVEDLRERADAGEYFFSFNQCLFVAEKPASAHR